MTFEKEIDCFLEKKKEFITVSLVSVGKKEFITVSLVSVHLRNRG